MLDALGFDLIEACHAHEAMQHLEDRDDVALLYTDVRMPGPMFVRQLAHVCAERLAGDPDHRLFELSPVRIGTFAANGPIHPEAMRGEVGSIRIDGAPLPLNLERVFELQPLRN